MTDDATGLEMMDVGYDFVLATFDHKIREGLSEEYYSEEDGVQPEFDDDDKDSDLGGFSGRLLVTTASTPEVMTMRMLMMHVDDPGFNMDADFNPSIAAATVEEKGSLSNTPLF